MTPAFSPAKAIPQFTKPGNCVQRSRFPIGLLLLAMALFLTRQAAADIVSFPAVAIPQTVTGPGSDCPANYQDCSEVAEGSFTAMALDGTPMFGISSTYSFQDIDPEFDGAGDFKLYFDGAIMGSVYKNSQWIAPTVGDTVGPNGSFQNFDFSYSDYVLDEQYWPIGGEFTYDTPYGRQILDELPFYAGYKFQAGGQTYYGWFSLDWNGLFTTVMSPPTISLDAYAYEACPNAPISIGATSGGATCSDPLAPTPEPPTLVLCLISAGALVLALRRKYAAAA